MLVNELVRLMSNRGIKGNIQIYAVTRLKTIKEYTITETDWAGWYSKLIHYDKRGRKRVKPLVMLPYHQQVFLSKQEAIQYLCTKLAEAITRKEVELARLVKKQKELNNE